MSSRWQIKWDKRAFKELRKIEKKAQEAVIDYLDERIVGTRNPRELGRALMYDKKGLWRYRIGNYRVICKIVDDELVILALRVGHRKHIYR